MRGQAGLIVAMLLLASACGGPDITKKADNNGANNGGNNGGTNNGTTVNNGGTNNGTTVNNGGTNNGTTVNNGGTNNGTTVNNGGTNNGTDCIEVLEPVLDFATVNVGDVLQLDAELRNCGDTSWDVLSVSFDSNAFETPAAFPVTITAGQSVLIPVNFAPFAPEIYEDFAIVSTSVGDVEIEVVGEGASEADCVSRPRVLDGNGSWVTSTVVSGLATLELDGSTSSAAGGIGSYMWTVAAAPPGASSDFVPSAAAASATFFADVPGRYEFILEVFENGSRSPCDSASVSVEVQGAMDVGILTQLTWNTPGDSDQTDGVGTDLDLHYVAPGGQWNMPPLDCFWQNPNPDWGAAGSTNDPSVDRDDIDGAGPENISHPAPMAGTYAIGVHYYDDQFFGPSDATVKVFADGVLVYEVQRNALATKQFWDVGRFSTATGTVSPMDSVTTDFPAGP